MLLEIALVFGGFMLGMVVMSWLASREYKPLNEQWLEDYGPCCGTCVYWCSADGWCGKQGDYYDEDAPGCEHWWLFDPDDDHWRRFDPDDVMRVARIAEAYERQELLHKDG